MQAADHFLVNRHSSPLTLFSPMFVSALFAEQLETIAGADQGMRRTRAPEEGHRQSGRGQEDSEAKTLLSNFWDFCILGFFFFLPRFRKRG